MFSRTRSLQAERPLGSLCLLGEGFTEPAARGELDGPRWGVHAGGSQEALASCRNRVGQGLVAGAPPPLLANFELLLRQLNQLKHTISKLQNLLLFLRRNIFSQGLKGKL